MDIQLRQRVIEQERQKLDWLKRYSADERFPIGAREKAARYACALQSYVNAIVLMSHTQQAFEEEFHAEVFGNENGATITA